MSRVLNELELVQNVALGAIALWTFVTEYEDHSAVHTGPTLPMLMPVYPALCHARTRRSIMNRQYDGGLLAAIAADRGLFLGLQERMIIMSEKTLRSLNIALSTELIHMNSATGHFSSNRKTTAVELNTGVCGEFMKGARRLGRWAAEMNPSQYYALLKVRF